MADSKTHSQNPTRFYSLALGKFDNLKTVSSHFIALADSAPSVAQQSILFQNSAGTLALSTFRDGSEGQLVLLVNRGTGTVTFSGTAWKVTDNTPLSQYDNALFMKNGANWIEITRSHAGGGTLSTNSASNGVLTLNYADSSPNIANVKTIVCYSGQTLDRFDGGVAGQVINIVNMGAALTLSGHASYFLFAGSVANYAIAASCSEVLISGDGTLFMRGSI